MLRLLVALSVLPACDRGSNPAPVVPDKPVAAKPAQDKDTEPEVTRAGALGVDCRCRVDIALQVETEDGELVAYTYKRIDAAIGEAESRGHDVRAQLRAAEESCREEREAWSEEKLEAYFQGDGVICELAANEEVLGEVGLTPECKVLGLAYFDNAGELLEQNEIGTRCAKTLDTLKVTELAPGAGPQVLLEFEETVGRNEEQLVGSLRIFALEQDGAYLVDLFETPLSERRDAGGCTNGVDRTFEFDTEGSLTVVSTGWSTCPDRCTGDAERCEEEPVTSRVTWDASSRTFGH